MYMHFRFHGVIFILIILITPLCFVLSAGVILPGAFLVICGYYGNNTVTAIVFMSCAVGASGLGAAGFFSNHLDIAPSYAGILMGITNTAGTVPGIIAPLVAKLIANAVSLFGLLYTAHLEGALILHRYIYILLPWKPCFAGLNLSVGHSFHGNGIYNI